MTGPTMHKGPSVVNNAEITVDGVTRQTQELLAGLESGTATPAKLREVDALLKQANQILKPLTEEQLRAEGRVHGPEAYAKLGLEVTGEIPVISPDLVALCATQPVRSMIVLDAGHSLIDLAKASEGGWQMYIGDAARKRDFASATHDAPIWVIVPMEVSTEPQTLGMPKINAIRAVQEDPKNVDLTISAPDPRLKALGILLHERATGEKLLQGVYTLTSESNVVVGYSRSRGFSVHVDHYCRVDAGGIGYVALAPVGIKKT
jgi:hypothetical protein